MFLETKEVSIYYEIHGQGQPLLLIHGAAMDADWYQGLVAELIPYYQLITYDRRGSSRSVASEDASFDLKDQVEDAKALLDHLGIEKITIVGASAGGVLAHLFLLEHPEMVEQIIIYEPAILTLLEGTEHTQRPWVDKVEDLIARNKLNSAVFQFVLSIGELDPNAPAKTEEQSIREMKNLYHFLSKEYVPFMEHYPDMDKTKELANRITVAIGDESKGAAYATAAKVFAERIGKEVVHYPGLHNAAYDRPKEFAKGVLAALQK